MKPVPLPIDRYSSPETLSQIANAPLLVCELIFFVTEGDRRHISLLREGRGDSITWEERYAIIWVARSFTASSFPEIGRALAKDHSAVIRGFNAALRLRGASAAFRSMTDALVDKLIVQKRAKSGAGRG